MIIQHLAKKFIEAYLNTKANNENKDQRWWLVIMVYFDDVNVSKNKWYHASKLNLSDPYEPR